MTYCILRVQWSHLQGKVNTTLGKSHKALERSGNIESKSQHPSLDSLVNASQHNITREPGEHSTSPDTKWTQDYNILRAWQCTHLRVQQAYCWCTIPRNIRSDCITTRGLHKPVWRETGTIRRWTSSTKTSEAWVHMGRETCQRDLIAKTWAGIKVIKGDTQSFPAWKKA